MKTYFVKFFLLFFLFLASLTANSQDQTVRTFTRSNSYVNSVAFSPDGKSFLSGSGDNTMRLWDVSSDSCLQVFKGHDITIMSVCFSPTGKFALSGSLDFTLKLWDINNGDCIRTFKEHKLGISSVSISPDGKYALSGSFDKTLKLWDISTGKCIHTFNGHKMSVNSVSFSPDGNYALSGSADNTLRLWEIYNGNCVRKFKGHKNYVYAVAFSPDSKYAASASEDKTLKLWDISTGDCIRTFTKHTNSVYSLAFSNDGKYVISGSTDGTAKLWDINYNDCVHTFTGFSKTVSSISFSPDSKSFIAADGNIIKLFDLQPYIKSTTTINKQAIKPSPIIKAPDNTPLKDTSNQLATTINNYVEQKMNNWRQKDEFEKTIDYNKRMNDSNRKKEEFRNDKVQDLKGKEKIDWNKFKLSKYYPDNEIFQFYYGTDSFAIHVPNSEARIFKENKENLIFSNQDFDLVNNKFILAYFEVTYPHSDKVYKYDNDDTTSYVNDDLKYNSKPAVIDVPKKLQVENKVTVLPPKIKEEVPDIYFDKDYYMVLDQSKATYHLKVNWVNGKISNPCKDYYMASNTLHWEGDVIECDPATGVYVTGGLCTWYDAGMRKQYQCTMSSNKFNGKYTVWYPNGNIKQESNFINGVEDGCYKEYDENGECTSAFIVVMGKTDYTTLPDDPKYHVDCKCKGKYTNEQVGFYLKDVLSTWESVLLKSNTNKLVFFDYNSHDENTENQEVANAILNGLTKTDIFSRVPFSQYNNYKNEKIAYSISYSNINVDVQELPQDNGETRYFAVASYDITINDLNGKSISNMHFDADKFTLLTLIYPTPEQARNKCAEKISKRINKYFTKEIEYK